MEDGISKMMTKKKLFLISLILFITIFCIQNTFALTANSSNYSVSMFGTGMATGNSNSANYNSTFLSETKATTRNAESDSYRVNIGFFENTSPYQTVLINSYSVSPSSAYLGSTITFFISTTNAQSTWARITLPDSTTTTLTLNNNGNTYYIPQSVGIYNIVLYANSSVGGLTSVVDSFEILSITAIPPSGGGSSGGGSTTIIEKCTYNWDCTPWGVCSDGKQTRICKNIGTCEGNESKPVEEMQCSEALFDIALKLKNIELTENKTLRFSIDLTEKIGIEKIDAHIKYSIINKERYEIFSQIETKAIQRNLSYEKEIEEIKLVDGEYTLRVDILYGNLQRAFAEQKFKISNGKIETEESASGFQKITGILNNYKLFIIIMIIIIPFALRALLIFRKDGYQKRFKEKVKTKRKYLAYCLLVLLIFAFLTIILKTNITGRVINKLSSYNWRIILTPLIIISILALLIRLRKKIIELLSRGGDNSKKYPSNSVRGLVNKKVYSENDNYIRRTQETRFKVTPSEAKPMPFETVKVDGEEYLEIKPKPINNVEIKRKVSSETPASGNNVLLKLKEFLSGLWNKHKKYPSNSIKGLIDKRVYSEGGHYIGRINDIILGDNRINSLKIEIDKKQKFKTKGIVIEYKHVRSIGEIVIIDEGISEILGNREMLISNKNIIKKVKKEEK